MKKDVLVDSQFIKYAKKICFEFYKNLEKTNFKNISNIKLLELKKCL